MNPQQLKKSLTSFQKWFKINKSQAALEQKEREKLSEAIQIGRASCRERVYVLV